MDMVSRLQHLCRNVPIMMAPETLFGFGCANYPATNWATVDINLGAIFAEDAITHTIQKRPMPTFQRFIYGSIWWSPESCEPLCSDLGRRVFRLHFDSDSIRNLSLKFCKQVTIIPPHIVS